MAVYNQSVEVKLEVFDEITTTDNSEIAEKELLSIKEEPYNIEFIKEETEDSKIFTCGQCSLYFKSDTELENHKQCTRIWKNKCLSISEKKLVIQAVADGQLKKDVAKQFGILPSTLSMILKKKEHITGCALIGSRKRSSQGGFPRLEECLMSWIHQCRAENVPIGGMVIKDKARSFAKELGITGFAASEGWLSNFKNRHGIKFKKIVNWIQKLQEQLTGYEPRNVFNATETGLFYQCLPEQIPTLKDEKCREGELSTQRLTILLSCNMDGSQKLKPLVIGKSGKIGIKSLPVDYKLNKKSWMTAELFSEWLKSVNRDMKKDNRKILIFLDKSSVHNQHNLEHVKLIFFPQNSILPLQHGIIPNFKTLYRREMFSLVHDTSDKNITMLTAIMVIDKAWKNVNSTVINNSFKKSGFYGESSTALPNCEETVLTDYVNVDNDVSVNGAQILNLEQGDEEIDEEEPICTVSLTEAMKCLTKLRYYALGNNTSDDFFTALTTIENSLDNDRLSEPIRNVPLQAASNQ